MIPTSDELTLEGRHPELVEGRKDGRCVLRQAQDDGLFWNTRVTLFQDWYETESRVRTMDKNDPKIESLKAKVKAVEQEFDMAVIFHEVWKPTAYDEALLERMGDSCATNAFIVVSAALRREMLMALIRIWDSKTINFMEIAKYLQNPDFILALAESRKYTSKLLSEDDQISRALKDETEKALKENAAIIIQEIEKYLPCGSHESVLKNLIKFRNQRLAHRQFKISSPIGASVSDDEIEEFYQDISKLVQRLISLVLAVAYNPAETAELYRGHAQLFWAPIRGENTQGHPDYQAAPFVSIQG